MRLSIAIDRPEDVAGGQLMIATQDLRFEPATPQALIEFSADALRFIVCGVEVFRLTPGGMEYKGQSVEDAGVAYREITDFFSAAKAAMPKAEETVAPTGLLVERVANALAGSIKTKDSMARVAMCVIAGELMAESFVSASDWLAQEAER